MKIVGDIGGYGQIWEDVLAQLGVGRDFRLPSGVVVVQVGDLGRLNRRRGGSDLRIVTEADALIRNNPRQWIQLIGNHEIGYAGGPYLPGAWIAHTEIDAKVRVIIANWLTQRVTHLAVAIRDRHTPYLITHAGLTLQNWLDMGKPNHLAAAYLLNSQLDTDFPHRSRLGAIERGRPVNPRADVCWAMLVDELYGPWIEYGRQHPLPFAQIHGHASPWDYEQNAFMSDFPVAWMGRMRLVQQTRSTLTQIGRGRLGQDIDFVGVDWKCDQGGLQNLPELFAIDTAYAKI